MTPAGTRLERRNWKQQEGLFANPDFVARRVAPCVPELTCGWNLADWNVEIVRSKATDRITLRYTFGSLATIYGKAYFDPSLGRATHASLVHLWGQGFAAESDLAVPEPMGFIEEANLLIMRPAKGMLLNEFAAVSSLENALTATRAAARWLLKYQSANIPGLHVQSSCDRTEIFDIADALAKVAAECPAHSSLLIAMLHDLHAIAPKDDCSWRMVPLHGQFRPAHVFIHGNRTTVIDIEKICLSDPAKDVARYVHALKKTCFEEGGDVQRADELARTFIAEYRKLAPSSLENLTYFRALLALKAFGKQLKSRKVDEGERQAICEMYRIEFEEAIHGSAGKTIAA
jgi:aminoglycoside phosphotransferase (APT) family kinase protein